MTSAYKVLAFIQLEADTRVSDMFIIDTDNTIKVSFKTILKHSFSQASVQAFHSTQPAKSNSTLNRFLLTFI